MDQTEAPGHSIPSRCADTLFVIVTSFKIWIVLFSIFLFVLELFNWGIPLVVIGTIGVFLVSNKFKVPPAPSEVVSQFFGSDIRPLKNNLDSFSTVRSRLKFPGLREQENPQGQGHALTVIGHRGAGLDAPENSISAFRLCKARGCTAVEFDVSMTSDRVPVVFHDENILRMTGIDREVSEMTWEELRQVDISILHPLGEKFRNERVPTFEDAITTCLSLGLKFIIDLKDSDERMVEVVLEAFKKYPDMYNLAAVSSFSAKVVFLIRRQDPKIIGCMAWRPCYHRFRTWTGSWENLEFRNTSIVHIWMDMLWDFFDELAMNHIYWWFLGLSAYLLQKDCLTKEASYRWMKKGVRLFLWTVNSPLEKLHIVQNIQLGYLTDTLDAGDLTNSTTMPNYDTVSLTKLQSNPNSTPQIENDSMEI